MGATRGWFFAALGVIAAAVLALVLAAVLSGPAHHGSVHVEPEVSFALPPASEGCGGATAQAGGTTRVPMTVSSIAGQVAESVNVCIGGQGPFPFVLDSGAGQSTIDARLAKRLHLASAGPSSLFAGVGCTGTAKPVTSGAWSLEGVTLDPQQLISATLPQIGGSGEPVGLLGSDVWSRFGAIRLDFSSGALILPGPEGAPLDTSVNYTGTVSPPPTSLTGGQGTDVAITVSPSAGDVSLSVPVHFETGPRRSFVIDTGSSQSVVSSSVAHAQSLPPTSLAQRQATVCSVITVPLVHSGAWSVPGVPLHPQLLGNTDFGAISDGGIDGLLGSDQLERFGWVVLDYRGGTLVLG